VSIKPSSGRTASGLNSPILVALDFDDAGKALNFAKSVSPQDCRLKIGKELFTKAGPELVKELQAQGFDIFLDLKFHDIPNTVEKALRAAADLGVWMVNVHASGGQRMLEAARAALPLDDARSPLLIAVTVLTSMDQQDLHSIGCDKTPEQQALLLANLANECELDGVVCSAKESVQMKSEFGADFKLITPGIRPAESDSGDQRRVMTPAEAMAAGSDYLVIGRPITQAENPSLALQNILESLD
jgi:orotidine-5'-phosphate decarboxylase